MRVVAVEQDLVTALGSGVDACWTPLLSGAPVFSEVTRFDTKAFNTHIAALVPGLDGARPESLVMQMLQPLLNPLAGKVPEGTLILLATTTGEVDLLQRTLLNENRELWNRSPPIPKGENGFSGAGGKDMISSCASRSSVQPLDFADGGNESRLDLLLGKVQALLGVSQPGQIISAACASSSAAVAQGAALISAGVRDSVFVVACDAVTEFVYAGFASLMALDPLGARPFDKGRKGLTVGEGAGYVWLMSEARARREGRATRGVVAGWGVTCDANHMTGPSRDGDGLARAIGQALKQAGLQAAEIGSVSAHGTGTSYNDSMELKAFKRMFNEQPLPVYSVKGSMGHTMGLAGLAEMIMALKSLETQVVPPSSNLHDVDPEAAGWVSGVPRKTTGMKAVLSTNSGFGGVNAALVLTL